MALSERSVTVAFASSGFYKEQPFSSSHKSASLCAMSSMLRKELPELVGQTAELSES